jgi:hypothetical protein
MRYLLCENIMFLWNCQQLARRRFVGLDEETMSLQRVLETARKTGTPVIITDVAGREPMVILPLEQFEAMAGDGASVPAPRSPAREPISKEERVVRVLEEIAAERAEARVEQEAPIDIESLTIEVPVPQDLSLEERFYLEPLEDKSKAE